MRYDCELCEMHAEMLQSLSRQLDESQARAEQAERDALRYRFLAEPHSIDPYGADWGDAYVAVGDGRKSKEEIDAAIDAAIAANTNGGQE